MGEKDKYNLVEWAYNAKTAMKHFFLAWLWFFLGILCVLGVVGVVLAIVVAVSASSCTAVGDSGLMCAMTIIPPTFL